MSKTLSLPSAKSARPRRRQTRPRLATREDGRLSHPSKPVSIIASISRSCPAGPRTVRWITAWRSSVTTPVIMRRVIVGRTRSGARIESQSASTISGRLEPAREGGPRQLVHPRLLRRLRFRYRWQRIFPHSRFPKWGEAHFHRSHPHGARILLCCNAVGFSLRHQIFALEPVSIYISRWNLAITSKGC